MVSWIRMDLRAREKAIKVCEEKRAREEAEKAKATAIQQLKDEIQAIKNQLTWQSDLE